MADPVTLASAWSVLQWAWVGRWCLILGIGAAPVVLARVLRQPADSARWLEARRWCALFALLLTLWSGRLLIDTYRLESASPDALATAQCVLEQAPAHRFERLACANGERFWLEVQSEVPLQRGTHLSLTYLPATRSVVRITAL